MYNVTGHGIFEHEYPAERLKGLATLTSTYCTYKLLVGGGGVFKKNNSHKF